MNLKLNRPICFFDLETTGVDITKDRIVEIAVLKVFPQGHQESHRWLVNPEQPIPPQASAVHGITDEMVAEAPTFKKLAGEISRLIANSDLAGYNSNRFDIPLLAEEMLRAECDFDMSNRSAIDVQNIFHKKEQRTLSAAYQFYCQQSLENAHTAEAYTAATYEILKAQLDRYDDLENDVTFLSDFTTRQKFADFAGFLGYDDQQRICFNFGKHKGRLVTQVLESEPGYFSWLLNSDFPLYTKKVLTGIKLNALNSNPNTLL